MKKKWLAFVVLLAGVSYLRGVNSAAAEEGPCAGQKAPLTIAALISETDDPRQALDQFVATLGAQRWEGKAELLDKVLATLGLSDEERRKLLEQLRTASTAAPRRREEVTVEKICEVVTANLLDQIEQYASLDRLKQLVEQFSPGYYTRRQPSTQGSSQPASGDSRAPEGSVSLAVTGIKPIISAPIDFITTAFPTVQWSGVPNAKKYEVWFSKATSWTVPLLQATVGASTLSYTAEQAFEYGPYVVWVRALGANNVAGPWSEPKKFSYLPPAPLILEPNRDSANPKPTFKWLAANDVQEYELWVSAATSPTTALIQTRVSALTFTSMKEFLPGSYSLWVRSISRGVLGRWSDVRHFSIRQSGAICPDAKPGAGFVSGSCNKEDQQFKTWGGGCMHIASDIIVGPALNGNDGMTRMQAEDACIKATFGGYCDWKLPTQEQYDRLTVGSHPSGYITQPDPYSWAFDKNLAGPLPNDPNREQSYFVLGWKSKGSAIAPGSERHGVNCVRINDNSPSPLTPYTPTPTTTPTNTPTVTPTVTHTPTPSPSPTDTPFTGNPCGSTISGNKEAATCTSESSSFKSQNGGCEATSFNLVFSKPGNTNSVNSFRTWEQAKAYCNDLVEGCRDDWRLPTLAEYLSAASVGILRNYIPNSFLTSWTSTSSSPKTHQMFSWATNSTYGGNFGDENLAGVSCVRAGSPIQVKPQCSLLTITCTKDTECCSGRCDNKACAYPDPKTITKNRLGGFCIDNTDCEEALTCHPTGYQCMQPESKGMTIGGWRKERFIDLEVYGLKDVVVLGDRLVIYGGGKLESINPPLASNRSLELSTDGRNWSPGKDFPMGVHIATPVDFLGKAHMCGVTAPNGSNVCLQAISRDLLHGFIPFTYNLLDQRPAMISFPINGVEKLLRIGATMLAGSGQGLVGSRGVWVSSDLRNFSRLKNSKNSEDILPFEALGVTPVQVIDPTTLKRTLVISSSNAGETKVATTTDGINWQLASTFRGWSYGSSPAVFVVNNKIVIDGFTVDSNSRDANGRSIQEPKLFVSYDAGRTWQTKPGLPVIPGLIARSDVPAYFNEHLFRVGKTSDAIGSGSSLYVYPPSELLKPKATPPPANTPVPVTDNLCPQPPPGSPTPGACARQDQAFKSKEGGCWDIKNRLAVSSYLGVKNWANARQACDDLIEGGKCDWRLGSRQELQAIVAQSRLNGGGHISGNGNKNFNQIWAREAAEASRAWSVSWINGEASGDASQQQLFGVLCVRGEGITGPTSTYSCGAMDALRQAPPPGACKAIDSRHTTANGGCAIDNLKIWSQPRLSGSPRLLRLSEAVDYCHNSFEGGYCDWRLPSMGDFRSLSQDQPEKFLGFDSIQVYWAHPDNAIGGNSFSLREKRATTYNEANGLYAMCVRDSLASTAPGACVRADSTNRMSSTKEGCRDRQANLTWSMVSAATADWGQAKVYCQNLTEGGLGGWRLPAYQDFVNTGYANLWRYLAIPKTGFWTSSEQPGRALHPFYFDASGGVGQQGARQDQKFSVICVR